MLELLQQQRNESTENHRQRYHGSEIDTKKRNTGTAKERTMVLQLSF